MKTTPTNGEPLLALSIRQPWAWLILNAGKDVENRTWPTRLRGRFLVHAAKGMTRDEYAAAFDLFDTIETTGRAAIPSFGELERGGIVGSVELVDCVERRGSKWFSGPYGFLLRDPVRLEFAPCRGALGFFRPDIDQSALVPLGPAGAAKNGGLS